jgi:hypothetical protein
MTMDDQELASLRRAFAADSQPAEPALCPAPEKIWDAAHGALPTDEVREIVQHTATCAACAEDWRLARVLLEQQQEKETPAALPAALPFAPRRRSLRGLYSWGLAAAAALALTVVGVQWLQKPQPGAVYRENEQAVLHSQVAEGQALPRDSFRLKWSAPAAGAGVTYGIQVSTEDLRPVASAEGLKTPEYQVPAAALAGLPAGAKLLWKVEADLPESSGHLTSATFVTPVR